MKKTSSLLLGASFLLASTIASPLVANAADVCLSDGFGHKYVFKKVKALKKPGAVSPLSGIFLPLTGGAFPVAGTALVRADLSVVVGILVHGTSALLGNTFSADWSADTTLAGTGTYDGDGEYESDGAIVFTSLDCKTVTIP